jgi:hypothetical protein
VVIGDRVWTATFDAVVALDLDSGAIVQRHDVEAEIVTVVARDGAVLAVTADARIVPVPVSRD